MDSEVVEAVERLRKYRDAHLQMAKLVTEAHGDDLYVFDLLAIAVLNRSMCILRAFCDLILAENFIVAAPLVRLQLDNCLRFSAGWLVDDPHQFALSVLEGKRIDRLRDRRGKLMTDRYLVDTLSQREPRLRSLYDATSGYIHLSEKHMFNCMSASPEELSSQMKVSDRDAYVTEDLRLEAIRAFEAVTRLLFEFAFGWAYTKEHAEEIRGGASETSASCPTSA